MNNKKLKLESFPIWNDQFERYFRDKLNVKAMLNDYTEDNNSNSLNTQRPRKVLKPKSVLVNLKKEDDECELKKTLMQVPLSTMFQKVPVIRLTRCNNTSQTVGCNVKPKSVEMSKAFVNDNLQSEDNCEVFVDKEEEDRLISLDEKVLSDGVQGTTRNLPNILRNRNTKESHKTSCTKVTLKSPKNVRTRNDTRKSSMEDFDTQRSLADTKEYLKKFKSKRKQDHHPQDIKQESPNWIASGPRSKSSDIKRSILKTGKQNLKTSCAHNVMNRTESQDYELNLSFIKAENEIEKKDVAPISNYLPFRNSSELSSTNREKFLLARENSMQKCISNFSSITAMGRICSELENADYMDCLKMEEFVMDTDEVHKLLSPTIDGCFDNTSHSFVFNDINGNNINQHEMVSKVCSRGNDINNNNLSKAMVLMDLKKFDKYDQDSICDNLLKLQLSKNINNNYETDLLQTTERDGKVESFHNLSVDVEQSIVSNGDFKQQLDSLTSQDFNSLPTDLDTDLYLLCNKLNFLNEPYIADDQDNLLPENINTNEVLMDDYIYDNDLLKYSENIEYTEVKRPQRYGAHDCLIQSYNFQTTVQPLSTGIDKDTMDIICDENRDDHEDDVDILTVDNLHSDEFETPSRYFDTNDFNADTLNSSLSSCFDDNSTNNEPSSTCKDSLIRNENLEGTSTFYDDMRQIDDSCADSISICNSNDELNKENYNTTLEDLYVINEAEIKNKAKPSETNLKLKDNESLSKRCVKTLRKSKSSRVNSKEIFTCDKCLQKYKNCDTLKRHTKLHDNYSLTCKTCDKHFTRKVSLVHHVSNAHANQETFLVN